MVEMKWAAGDVKGRALAAVEAAKNASWMPAPVSGCGRAYVVVSGDRAEVNALSAACKKADLMFLRKAYGVSGPSVYMGYDNADGRAMGRAKAFAEKLQEHGFRAYADGVGD